MNIGVTGGFGTGKSSVSLMLASLLQAEYFSADICCRELLKPGAKGWIELRASWGEEFFQEDDQVDRARLKDTIFKNSAARKELESILHPLVREQQQLFVEKVKGEKGFVVAEIPLLFENSLESDYDITVVVYSPDEVALQRGCLRDNLTPESGRRIIASQLPIEDKIKAADYVIDNSGMKSSTYLQVLHLSNEVKEVKK